MPLFQWMSSVCILNRLKYNGESILHSFGSTQMHMVSLQEIHNANTEREMKRERESKTCHYHHFTYVYVYKLWTPFSYEAAATCTFADAILPWLREYGAQNESKQRQTCSWTNQPSKQWKCLAMEMETGLGLKTALSNYWNMWHRIIPTYCVCLKCHTNSSHFVPTVVYIFGCSIYSLQRTSHREWFFRWKNLRNKRDINEMNL